MEFSDALRAVQEIQLIRNRALTKHTANEMKVLYQITNPHDTAWLKFRQANQRLAYAIDDVRRNLEDLSGRYQPQSDGVVKIEDFPTIQVEDIS